MASSKRQSHHEGNDRDGQVPGNESKRRYGDSQRTQIRALQGPRMDDIRPYLEPIIRKVVQEAVPPILQRHILPRREQNLNQTGTSGGRGRALQLRFVKKLPRNVFTDTKVVAENDAPIEIDLCDARSQYSIVKDGPLSSIKIELCVLKGDFGSNGSDDWTAEEFTASILRPREGKRPLLVGNRFITLNNGVGYIDEVFFTDNSRWAKSGKFRLGAKIVEPTPDEASIREGRSEPIVVKDNRGAAYEKHDIPSLDDEIWRLRKIAKDGRRHEQLSKHGIKTVEDLLRLHITNPRLLKEKIGKISSKTLETLIEHAKACAKKDDGKRYSYRPTQQPIVLVFNSIYEVVGVAFDGQRYLPIESLNSEQKCLVDRVKQSAYQNVKDFIPFETSTQDLENTSTSLQAWPNSVPDQGLQQLDFPTACQGLCQPSTSKSHISEAVGTDQLSTSAEDLLNGLAGAEFIPELFNDVNGWALSPCYFPTGDGAECSNHFYYPDSVFYISNKGRGRTIWDKIRNALRWVIPFVAKRKAKLFPHNC